MNQENKKKNKFSLYLESKGLSLFGFFCFLFCIVIITTSVIFFILTDNDNVRSKLAFNAFESLLMIIYLLFPILVRKTLKVKIPKIMLTIYIVFCGACQILGEVMDFYGRIPWWDSLLHGFSGVLLGVLGFILVNTLNHIDQNKIKLNPLFVAFSVVCFAVTLGALWELVEYTIDGIFGCNMQQFMQTTDSTLVGGEDIALVGHAALEDTMKDLFLDLLGATIIAVIGYFQLKKEKSGFTHASLEILSDNDSADENNSTEPHLKTNEENTLENEIKKE